MNLRGTLEVIKLGMQVDHYHGLRRFSHVSTVAVAGKRQDEVVTEDKSVDWNRSDYDPYARTKKFSEHMIRELLPDTPKTIFRPSIVLGDSRRAETTQFDMVRAFVFLAGLPALPLTARDRVDIVNVDFVADAIATLHVKETHAIRHLSFIFRPRVADLPPDHRIVGRCAEQARSDLSAISARTVHFVAQSGGAS